ncbi:MAG: type II toxin-antitoxin system VapC family toxin [Thermoanaerobaculia bacterium]|nr:type II toxin-antitoxin system VapC family toxin [Thermoanaerobaculia bacterium]
MIVLDTHVWLWWVSDPGMLSPPARRALEYSKRLGLCPISCWEIATKVSQGRLELDRDVGLWVTQALARPALELLPITAEIAVAAGRLGTEGLHGDPADRLIVATARQNGVPLVTKDAALRAFSGVETIW